MDEKKYPTMKFFQCRKCKQVYVESMAGANDCPHCSSTDTGEYRTDGDHSPDEKER